MRCWVWDAVSQAAVDVEATDQGTNRRGVGRHCDRTSSACDRGSFAMMDIAPQPPDPGTGCAANQQSQADRQTSKPPRAVAGMRTLPSDWIHFIDSPMWRYSAVCFVRAPRQPCRGAAIATPAITSHSEGVPLSATMDPDIVGCNRRAIRPAARKDQTNGMEGDIKALTWHPKPARRP
jgi:hypothetical protein